MPTTISQREREHYRLVVIGVVVEGEAGRLMAVGCVLEQGGGLPSRRFTHRTTSLAEASCGSAQPSRLNDTLCNVSLGHFMCFSLL